MTGREVVIGLIALAVGVAVAWWVLRVRRREATPAASRSKILFPFVGSELSERALQATLRLAWADEATVVPAYLATVPLPLALDAPVGRACSEAFEVFEVIEQRAARVGVAVDGRIVRGRNVRHALRELIAEFPAVTRIVVTAAGDGRHDGFSVDDIAWLLRNAPGEVLVLRPDPERPAAPRDLRKDPLIQGRTALRGRA